ncbi:MAG: ISKra4 family transposase [Clostridia bacterium]
MSSLSTPARIGNKDMVTARREAIVAEVAQMVRGTLEKLPLSGPDALDLDAIEVAVRQELRRVGGRMVEGALVERVLACEEEPHLCPHCGRRMEREARRRCLVGLVGSYAWTRGYYRCRHCQTHVIPADSALGVGPGALSPALSRIAAMQAAQVSFDSAAGTINDTLGTELAEADVYRTAEALGAVAEAEEIAATTVVPVTPVTPASDTLLIGADGTTTFTDGDWHEVKVGVVAALGPACKPDPDDGHPRLVVGEKAYCAFAGSADDFFPRLAALARTAGWGHPAIRTVVAIGDGSPWIWNRLAAFNQPGVERVEVLDYIHASQHVWDAASAVYGSGTFDAHAWAEPLCVQLKEHGPDPVLAALRKLSPPATPTDSKVVANALEYLSTHAKAGRMDYPRFAARGLPIASGIVEAGCNSVVCQRTKGAGKRWRRLGAQTILNLRCLRLSPSRWTAFFHRHPALRRPPVATLRREAA